MTGFDRRTALWIAGATILGAIWAIINFNLAGNVRGPDVVPQLVWTVFAIPFATFIGWIVARRNELGLAAFSCFAIYFFSPFVASRIESLIDPAAAASPGGLHSIYFITSIIIQTIACLTLAIWRARSAEQATSVASTQEEAA